MAQLCQMTIGFLIPRVCGNKAQFTCSTCGRAICTEHAVILDSGVACEACHLGFESAIPSGGLARTVADYNADDAGLFLSQSDDEDMFDDFS